MDDFKGDSNLDSIKETTPKKYKRYWVNYFIYPKLQCALALINVLILLCAITYIYFQVQHSFTVIEEIATKANIPKTSYIYSLMGAHKEIVTSAIFTSGILASVLVFVITVLLSHKSLGAIYRLKLYFTNLSENGYVDKLIFRSGDLHGELPEIINKGIDKVRNTEDLP